ncbi:MAG: TonB family protein [Brevundimonas sp.]|nr:MAG: TonB family protein [Brevundimonas sp.]
MACPPPAHRGMREAVICGGDRGMGGRFQRRGLASALILSAAATLMATPAVARQTSNAAQARPTPPSSGRRQVAPPVIVPGPPAPPRDPNLPSMITNPSWVRPVSPEYPATAIANGVTEGRVTLRCTGNSLGALVGCEVVAETPEGQGFGDATLAAARRARLSPLTVDGAAEDASVQFSVRFIAPVMETPPPPPPTPLPLMITEIVPIPDPASPRSTTLPPGVVPDVRRGPPPPPQPRSSVITTPSWARQPQPEYPAMAIASGVAEGRATLRCTALPNGGLSDCEVIDETPSGHGFAESALAATARARFSPRTVDAASQGARVQFTIRFAALDSVAPAPKP